MELSQKNGKEFLKIMKTCNVYKTEISDISIDSLYWERAEKLDLDWSWENKAPKTSAYMLYGDEGISVKFETEEYPVTVNYFNDNDPVNRDSCVEFFLTPDCDEKNTYLNFEMNANGVLHLQIGVRGNRQNICDVDFNVFNIETKLLNSGWILKIYIPFDFLKKYFKNISNEMRGNLYKCGDRTENPHYLSWSPVKTLKPDFHNTESFGKIKLS